MASKSLAVQRRGLARWEASSNTLRKLRFDHGEMTQEVLAAKVGVTRQTDVRVSAPDRDG